MPSISLVVPAYNEEAGLAATVERCRKAVQQCTDDYEIIILDDCSQDKTVEVMERLRAEDPAHIKTMRHLENKGIARTFEDLYRAASKEYVFLIPGDGEYPPEALVDCMPLLGTCDIVICRRVHKNYTLYRRIVSGLYRHLIRLLFGVELYDPGTVKLVKREVYTSVPVECKSVFVEAERMIRAARRGYRIGTVDIVQETRKGGKARGARFETVWGAGTDLLRVWVRLVLLRQQP